LRISILNWRDTEHPSAGGAELFVQEVATRWMEQGHRVSVVSSRHRGMPSRHWDGDIAVYRVGRLNVGTHHLLAPTFVRKAIRPDVVLESINTIPYELPRRFSHLPFVTLVHQMALDVWDAHLPRPAALAAQWAERQLLRVYRQCPVIAVSPSTASDLRAAGLRSVDVVAQGGIGAQKPFPKESSPTMLFVGRLAANKRPDHALTAFSLLRERVPDAKMWLVGTGPLLGQLSSSLPSGVQLLGRLERSELLERMSRAHLLIATSVREGWGLVITEANAMGTPAVAYAVPGLRDAVRNGETGVLTRTEPSAIAEAAHALLDDGNLYASLRESAIRWGSSHTWDRTARQILEALERAAGNTSIRSSLAD
jgi:glycosyltransferase involved in cell wall biosynthesis